MKRSPLWHWIRNKSIKIINIYKIIVLHKNPKILKLEEYRKSGIKIGDNCHIFSSLPTERDCFFTFYWG